jgi:hypothetical protein
MSPADARLAAVLDALIPPGGDFPGGGAVALAEAAAALVARADLAALLDAIEAHAGGRAFAALALDEREAVLRAVEGARPEPFTALVEVAYRAYYGHPEVARRLGLAGPPQPRGHVVPPMDPALVERVRQRPSLYRPA